MQQRLEAVLHRSADRQIILGEASAGMAAPIVAWYPEGAITGRQFIYNR